MVLGLGLMLASFTALAVAIFPFPGWNELTEKSSDIVIARCMETPPQFEVESNGVILDRRDGLIDSDLRVISCLKGESTNGTIRLRAQYWPRQNEDYLVFGHSAYGVFHAYEEYRVVPLGLGFPTNDLAGKSLDEQVKLMLQWRLDALNRESQHGEDEKKRLESGLK